MSQNKYAEMTNRQLATELLYHELYIGNTPRSKQESDDIITTIVNRLNAPEGRMDVKDLPVRVSYTFSMGDVLRDRSPSRIDYLLQDYIPGVLREYLDTQEKEYGSLFTPVVKDKILTLPDFSDVSILASKIKRDSISVTVYSDGNVSVDYTPLVGDQRW